METSIIEPQVAPMEDLDINEYTPMNVIPKKGSTTLKANTKGIIKERGRSKYRPYAIQTKSCKES